MSNFYVSYSDEAHNDLRNIFMHISYVLGSRDNAEGQVNRIREAVKKLDKFPKRNPLVQSALNTLFNIFLHMCLLSK